MSDMVYGHSHVIVDLFLRTVERAMLIFTCDGVGDIDKLCVYTYCYTETNRNRYVPISIGFSSFVFIDVTHVITCALYIYMVNTQRKPILHQAYQ